MSRVILCFGDSNTWGQDPATGQRFGADGRWPGVMAASLGPSYRIIEEGLPGRTTMWDDPNDAGKNGLSYLGPCLASHRPIDIVVVMLGSNDLKSRFDLEPAEIAAAIEVVTTATLASNVRPDGGSPQVVLVSPPLVTDVRAKTEDFRGATSKSGELGHRYQAIAQKLGTAFVDAAPLAPPSAIDGLHLPPASHRRLGEAIADTVRQLTTT